MYDKVDRVTLWNVFRMYEVRSKCDNVNLIRRKWDLFEDREKGE